VTRNAIDNLDNAFKHFFRRCKSGDEPGFPKFKKKGVNDSFALREAEKFDVGGRRLRIEKLPTRIRMRQKVRFSGSYKQVTLSQRAGKYFASVLVETQDYNPHAPDKDRVGVDFGIKELATLSTGEAIPANQKLKCNLKALKRRSRNLSRKQKGSHRRAKAKLSLARLHLRIANQRQAALHVLSDRLTREYKTVVIEDLNVRGMVRNHRLACAVSDAGFGMLRRQLEYKAELRGTRIVLADRFFPSSRLCAGCGQLHDMPLERRVMNCECGTVFDRDHNAAMNLLKYGLDTLALDLKRTQETGQTGTPARLMTA
jgi:putative transposase